MNTRHQSSFSLAHLAPADPLRALGLACSRCYQHVARQLAALKARVEREFGMALDGYEHLLKAAVNEAEALAWQTPYPHLFFPALAQEKAEMVQRWAAHQRAVLERTSTRHAVTF